MSIKHDIFYMKEYWKYLSCYEDQSIFAQYGTTNPFLTVQHWFLSAYPHSDPS